MARSALASLVVDLTLDNSKFTKGLSDATSKLSSAGQKMKSAGKTMTAGLTLPLAAIGAASVKMASDAEEAGNKFDVVMGGASDRVRAKLEDLTATIPMTRTEMEGLAAGIQDMLVPMGVARDKAAGMSAGMVELAGDLGSFNNVPTAQVLEAMKSALAGSSEPMRRFGVDTRKAALEQIAFEEGLVAAGEELDNAATAQAVLIAIQRDSTDAMGDAARTVDSTANSMKFLARDARQLGIDIGETLIPAVRPLIQHAREALGVFQGLSPQMQKTAVVVGGLVAAAGPLLIVLGSIASATAALIPVIAAISAPMLAGAAVFGVVVAAGIAVVKHWNVLSFEAGQLAKLVTGAFSALKGAISGALTAVAQKFEWFTGPLVELGSSVAALTGEVIRFFVILGDRIRAIVTDAASAIVDRLVTFLAPLGTWLWDQVLNPVIGRFRDLTSTVAEKVGAMGSTVWEIVKTMAARITNVIASMWAGVVGKVQSGVDRVTGLFQGMSDVLVGNSIIPDMADMSIAEFTRLADGMIVNAETGVGGVEGEFGKLPGIMTDVAGREIGATLDKFIDFGAKLPTEVTGLIDTVQSHWSKIKDIFADPLSEGLKIAKKAFFDLTDDIIDALPGFFSKVGGLLGKFGDFLKDIFQIGKGNEPGFFIGFGGNPFGDIPVIQSPFTEGTARMLGIHIAEQTAHLYETISEPLLQIRDLLAEAVGGAMGVQAGSAAGGGMMKVSAAGGGGSTNVSFEAGAFQIQVPPGTADPEGFGAQVAGGIRRSLTKIDRNLGQRTQRDRRMSGDRSLAPGR